MTVAPSPLTLRRAVPEDAPAVTVLVREAYGPWVELIGREPMPMTVDYAAALAAHRFDVLEAEGRLEALIETVATGDHLLIVNIAVRPGLHGRGMGRALLAHAEDLARQAGLAELRLYTNQRFARNIEIYRRFGYAVDREEALPNGVAVHMRKATPAD